METFTSESLDYIINIDNGDFSRRLSTGEQVFTFI